MQKNANKGTNWLHYIGDLVAANPKMSALIAFELGQLAGRVSLEAAAKYKSLKPKIGEARDYLAANAPSVGPGIDRFAQAAACACAAAEKTGAQRRPKENAEESKSRASRRALNRPGVARYRRY
jgi:hypothetical protein